jgi:serine protease Do
VGINTAIFSQDGGNVGIGFAIPTVMVKVVVRSILKDGRAIRGWLGAKSQTITSEIADALGLERPIGVIVNKVYDLSPAKKSGIRVGDILLSVNGNDIIDSNNLSYLLATVEVGSKTNLIILRDNIQKNIDIILIPPPERPLRNVKTIEQNIPPFGGITIANLNPALAEELGVETQEGVIVLSIIRRSFARQIGLSPGDLIVQVNGKKIEKVSDFLKVISKQDRDWVFTFNRGGKLIQRSIRL